MKSKFKYLICYILLKLVRISWTYGGKEVYITGSFTNWDYMIKMSKKMIGETPIFEISMVSYYITLIIFLVCERRHSLLLLRS